MRLFGKRGRAKVVLEPTKQPLEESDRTIQANSFNTSMDRRHSIATINTSSLLLFIAGIIEEPLPNNWMMTMFNKYNGSIDLNEYNNIFMNQMVLYTTSDVVWYPVFSTLLKGESLT